MTSVDNEIDTSLDLVNFTRRLRMHGYGISLILKEKELLSIGDSSERKDIKDIDKESRARWR